MPPLDLCALHYCALYSRNLRDYCWRTAIIQTAVQVIDTTSGSTHQTDVDITMKVKDENLLEVSKAKQGSS